MVGFYIGLEEDGTALLCCKLTKTKDPSLFRYSDRQKEFLRIALEPYKDWLVEALPAWLPLMLIYGGLKADQIMTAVEQYNIQKTNTAAKNNPQKMQQFAQQAASKAEKEERTNFKLYNDGYYANYPTGGYVKRDSPDKEKPSFTDIDKIMDANPLKLVLKAFDMTEEELRAKGVTIPTDE